MSETRQPHKLRLKPEWRGQSGDTVARGNIAHPRLDPRALSPVKKVFALLVCALLALLAVLAFNTWRASRAQPTVPAAPPLLLDEKGASERLAAAVRIPTVSSSVDPHANDAAFEQLQRHLVQSFPRVHGILKLEPVGDHSLLYTWQGSDPSLKPILLMAHMDVVPVDQATAAQWKQPGFSGAIADGYIWGRGSWDNKGNLFAQLEAIESMLGAGYVPKRTIYLFSGADEEIGGNRGAKLAAGLLKQRNVRLQFVLDEGLVVTEGIIPGLASPAALIGIAQKGYVSIELSTTFSNAGHSSMPPLESAIGALAEGLTRLQLHEYEIKLEGVPELMLRRLGPRMSFPLNTVMANLWLFHPMVAEKLAGSDSTRAQLHTTMALTMIEGGVADNVLPARARALANFRILPGESVQSVVDHVRAAVRDPRISVTAQSSTQVEPSRVSSVSSPGYRVIEHTIRETFSGAAVAPGLFTAHADGGYFEALADDVYLFSPVRAGPRDPERVHGVDERITVKNYVEMINFYAHLLHNTAG